MSTRRADTVSDAIGCVRLFGSVFLLSGTVALSVALLGGGGMEAESWSTRGIFAVIGLSHLAGGYLIGWRRWNECTVTRAGIEHAEHRTWRRSVRRHIAPSLVREVTVSVETDGEGGEAYGVELELTDGERLRLTRHSSPSRPHAEEIRDAVQRRLGISSPALASGETGTRQRPTPRAVSRHRRRASLQP